MGTTCLKDSLKGKLLVDFQPGLLYSFQNLSLPPLHLWFDTFKFTIVNIMEFHLKFNEGKKLNCEDF